MLVVTMVEKARLTLTWTFLLIMLKQNALGFIVVVSDVHPRKFAPSLPHQIVSVYLASLTFIFFVFFPGGSRAVAPLWNGETFPSGRLSIRPFICPSTLRPRWLGLRPCWLGRTLGWLGLRPYWLGIRPGWLALRLGPQASQGGKGDKWTNKQMDKGYNISPF